MEATEQEFDFPVTMPVRDNALVEIESARAVQEVQASMVIAKRFPRDQNLAYTRIIKACERLSLAKNAQYAYPRGGQSVTGPSIRLAEVLALNWGNLEFGIRELSQTDGWSEIEAFAWDLETNTKQVKTFKVPHKRYTKERGNVSLTDPRDIYEHIANQGARRVRACILGVVPGDIVEAALDQCERTMRRGNADKPLQDRIRIMLKGFSDIGVNQAMIKTRLGHNVDLITEEELLELNKIGRSLIDNMTSREDWFGVGATSDGEEEVKEFNAAIPKAVDRGQLKTFLAKSAHTFGLPVAEVKRQALEDINGFLAQFKNWQAKEKPEPSEKDPIRKQYINLKPAGFSTWVYKNLDMIRGLDASYQTEIKSKWDRLYPEDTYPLDKPENAATGQDALPGRDSEGETEGESTDAENPEKQELSEKVKLILSLVENSHLDVVGRPCVPCPNRNGQNALAVEKCNATCEERQDCPTWSEYDK